VKSQEPDNQVKEGKIEEIDHEEVEENDNNDDDEEPNHERQPTTLNPSLIKRNTTISFDNDPRSRVIEIPVRKLQTKSDFTDLIERLRNSIINNSNHNYLN
jgi:hypothetical protein